MREPSPTAVNRAATLSFEEAHRLAARVADELGRAIIGQQRNSRRAADSVMAGS